MPPNRSKVFSSVLASLMQERGVNQVQLPGSEGELRGQVADIDFVTPR
jgi:predicted RNA-binding protein